MIRLRDVRGQDAALSVLRSAVARGRLHHALLFVGPEGVGKRTTALALAAWLLCDSPADDDSCGRCAACAQLEAGTHPDLHVETLEPPKDDEERKNITIEQVRSVQAKIAVRPIRGARNVVVVDEAHALSHEAQNAFLKTLEEPPDAALLVLVSHVGSALLPTVRSRCQRVTFPPLPAAELVRLLVADGRAADDAALLGEASGGSLGVALSLGADRERETRAELAARLDAVRGEGHHRAVVDAAQAMNRPRRHQREAEIRPLVEHVRRELRARASEVAGRELTPRAKTASLRHALAAAETAHEALLDVGRNANPSLSLERMWLRLSNPAS